ncbi:MAG: hypothetical protein H7A23_22470 [Leptospiraceae bacterium]|nr:hypothetical protein [Leptospiraceae bacterium]MCP5497328.1 hypothetical protein [Leptospiraceae bacterium]
MVRHFLISFVLLAMVSLAFLGCSPKKEPVLDEETIMFNAGEAFLNAFKEGNADFSFNIMSASAQAKLGGTDNWAKIISEGKKDGTLPSQWEITSKKITKNELGMKVGVLEGNVVTKGKNSLQIILTKIDNDWKIDGFSIK